MVVIVCTPTKILIFDNIFDGISPVPQFSVTCLISGQKLSVFASVVLFQFVNPLMPGGNKKVTHT